MLKKSLIKVNKHLIRKLQSNDNLIIKINLFSHELNEILLIVKSIIKKIAFVWLTEYSEQKNGRKYFMSIELFNKSWDKLLQIFTQI